MLPGPRPAPGPWPGPPAAGRWRPGHESHRDQRPAQGARAQLWHAGPRPHRAGSGADLLHGVLPWLPEIERASPDLAEELRGIAEGSGRPLAEIIMLNARSELLRASSAAGRDADGCTVFGLLQHGGRDAPFYVGGNWDWREATRDHWLLLRILQPPKPAVSTVVEAGQLARFGVNSAGIALFVNGLNGFRPGEISVPQLVVRRQVLDSAD